MNRSIWLWCLLGWLLLWQTWSVTAQVRVACIGDSVTEGLGIEHPEQNSYPAQLQTLLGNDYVVGNFGHSGATLLRNGYRPYADQIKFKEALDFKPDIAVIHLGLNDTDPRTFPHYRDQFVSDYIWLIDTLLTINPAVEIYVCSLTPIFTGHPRFTSSTYRWHQDIRKQIKHVVKARGTHFIDLFEKLRHRPDLITDTPTLHPNVKGAALIAKTVYQHLTGDYGGFSVDQVWGSHMVLQKGSVAKLRGQADSGTTVTVSWRGNQYSTVVEKDGKWEIPIETGDATHIPQELTITNSDNEIKLHDLLVGQVWLAMGQSNMEWRLDRIEHGDSLAYQYAGRPHIRLLRFSSVEHTGDYVWSEEGMDAANNLHFFTTSWSQNSVEAAKEFSAIGYAFASYLSDHIDEPIGIIQIAVGGAPLISWVSRERLLENPLFHQAFIPWRKSDFIMQWCRERADKNLSNRDQSFQRHPYEPAYIHESGSHLIEGIPIAGLIWYQGESDAENAELHQVLFPLFTEDIRQAHGVQTPIYTVQLSSIERPSWPYFRATQTDIAMQLPNVHIVTSHDLGHKTEVHPMEKLPIAKRLADKVLIETYGFTNTPNGITPLPKGLLQLDDGSYIIEIESEGYPLEGSKGLEVLTEEGELIPIHTTIIGNSQNTLHFTLPTDSRAVAIVYAYRPFSSADIKIKGGQPIPTFRINLSDL